jgi:predicted nucleic-acid-binding Zn-ribbon protein
MNLIPTICLRCGYPVIVPERLKNEIRWCIMCRTTQEEKEHINVRLRNTELLPRFPSQGS